VKPLHVSLIWMTHKDRLNYRSLLQNMVSFIGLFWQSSLICETAPCVTHMNDSYGWMSRLVSLIWMNESFSVILAVSLIWLSHSSVKLLHASLSIALVSIFLSFLGGEDPT